MKNHMQPKQKFHPCSQRSSASEWRRKLFLQRNNSLLLVGLVMVGLAIPCYLYLAGCLGTPAKLAEGQKWLLISLLFGV